MTSGVVFTHAFFMAAGVAVIMSAALIAMTLRKKVWWLKVHRPLGIAGVLFMTAGLTAISLMPEDPAFSIIPEVHGATGISAVILACLAPVLGLLMFKLKKKWMRPAHRWAGRLCIIIAVMNILLGLFMTGVI